MNVRVTISLYSIETQEEPGYTRNFLKELSNIKKIRDGFVNAAMESKREPPDFIVSVLLVPNWDKENNSYINDQYLAKKYLFLEEAKDNFERIDGVKVEDFYSHCPMTDYERNYMHNLKALGINADMIKTRAIINNCDRCRHLQIDSNTIVPSFYELYNKTFNAAEQKDGINASYYDEFYISAHNKMVYTTPNGDIAKRSRLDLHLWNWCRDHKDDNNIDQDKNPEKNSIYARVFTEALLAVGYVGKYLTRQGKTIYPATLNDRVYWLTECMTTAINMSWSNKELAIPEVLKKLPPVPIGNDGLFNYQCFLNLIKKYTGDLSLHSVALGLSDDTSANGDFSRDLLLRVSNCELELQATRDFLINAVKLAPQHSNALLRLFEDTENGNKLTEKLFNCTVQELPEKVMSGLSYPPIIRK